MEPIKQYSNLVGNFELVGSFIYLSVNVLFITHNWNWICVMKLNPCYVFNIFSLKFENVSGTVLNSNKNNTWVSDLCWHSHQFSFIIKNYLHWVHFVLKHSKHYKLELISMKRDVEGYKWWQSSQRTEEPTETRSRRTVKATYTVMVKCLAGAFACHEPHISLYLHFFSFLFPPNLGNNLTPNIKSYYKTVKNHYSFNKVNWFTDMVSIKYVSFRYESI